MKKRQVVLYVVVMLILLATSVYATISAELNIKVTADDNIFYPGEEFIITIGVKDLTTTKGIKSIEGYIDVDENVLESLTLESIITENGSVRIGTNNELPVCDARDISSTTEKGIIFNGEPVSGKGDCKIVINLENELDAATDLINVKFKIKDNIAAGTYENVMSYKLFTLFSTDAQEKQELGTKSYGIKITALPNTNTVEPVNNIVEPVNNTVTPVNNTVEPVNNTVAPVNNTVEPINNTVAPVNNTVTPVNNTVTPVNNTVKPVNNTVAPVNNTVALVNNVANKAGTGSANRTTNTNVTANKVDNTVSPTRLPKTGYRLILIPIIAIAIVGFVFYKKYSKYNNFHV